MGASGSGKSTLFKVLQRLWAHSSGEIVLGGQALGALPRAAQVRAAVAALPQGGLAHAKARGFELEKKNLVTLMAGLRQRRGVLAVDHVDRLEV